MSVRRSVRSWPERGSAGLLLVWVSALVVVATAAAAVWGGAVVARHRAARAADLAALAAARSAATGWAEPCAVAARVAAAQGARVQSCGRLLDGSTAVVVAVDGPDPGWLFGLADLGPARARARAGTAP